MSHKKKRKKKGQKKMSNTAVISVVTLDITPMMPGYPMYYVKAEADFTLPTGVGASFIYGTAKFIDTTSGTQLGATTMHEDVPGHATMTPQAYNLTPGNVLKAEVTVSWVEEPKTSAPKSTTKTIP